MKVQEKQNLHRLMWLANVQQFFQDKSVSILWEHYATWINNRDNFETLYREFPLKKLCELDKSGIERVDITGILITFHYGPYRLLPKLLVQKGYQVSLLVSGAVLEREIEHYRSELEDAELLQDQLECIDANQANSLRHILQAIKNKRLVLLFLDADEGVGKPEEGIGEHKLAVPFGSHFFYWRTNIFKLACRFGIPVHCTFMKRANNFVQWQITPFINIMETADGPAEELMMRAFSALQMAFQQMMQQGWIYWENWAFIHQYNGQAAIDKRGITAKGSWLAPFEYNRKKYLFDVKNRQFFEVASCFTDS
ncbi:hypothetical protein ABE426_05535 [Sphingobacterium faecium]|uniref:hypothetical protein n=1 Tax=Sphingobacterium faecium TaxID=34087 RepID=UPI0032083872